MGDKNDHRPALRGGRPAQGFSSAARPRRASPFLSSRHIYIIIVTCEEIHWLMMMMLLQDALGMGAPTPSQGAGLWLAHTLRID